MCIGRSVSDNFLLYFALNLSRALPKTFVTLSLQSGGMGTHKSFVVAWESQHENEQMLRGTYDLLFILQQFQETIFRWGWM